MAIETEAGQIPHASPLPEAALERWAKLPADAPIALVLTRGDVDNLLLALRNLAIGQSQLSAALAAHVNQDMEGCVGALMRTHEVALSAFDRVNALAAAVMRTAAPGADG